MVYRQRPIISAHCQHGNLLPVLQGFLSAAPKAKQEFSGNTCLCVYAWREGQHAKDRCTVYLLAAPVGSALRSDTRKMAKSMPLFSGSSSPS